MTDKEKAIVMAYTGVVMLKGDKLQIFYDYLKRILNRRVSTLDLSDQNVWNEIEEKSKPDFIRLCEQEE